MKLRAHIWLGVLCLLVFSGIESRGETLIAPAFDWTIQVGRGELGACGWDRETRVSLVFVHFDVPVSGRAFRAGLVLSALVLSAAIFAALFRHARYRPVGDAESNR